MRGWRGWACGAHSSAEPLRASGADIGARGVDALGQPAAGALAGGRHGRSHKSVGGSGYMPRPTGRWDGKSSPYVVLRPPFDNRDRTGGMWSKGFAVLPMRRRRREREKAGPHLGLAPRLSVKLARSIGGSWRCCSAPSGSWLAIGPSGLRLAIGDDRELVLAARRAPRHARTFTGRSP